MKHGDSVGNGKVRGYVTYEAEFRQWLADSKPGDRIVYHTGLLMRDRFMTGLTLRERAVTQAGNIANAAWQASELKKVELFQKRIEEGICDYIAVRRGEQV